MCVCVCAYDFVVFYGILNFVACLMLNLVDIYIYISSSYRAGSTDIPDPLSPLLPIVHRPSRSCAILNKSWRQHPTRHQRPPASYHENYSS